MMKSHLESSQNGISSSVTRTSLMFGPLTGKQAVLSMISAAALYSLAESRGHDTNVFITEVLKGYDIGTDLAERLLKGKLLHGFREDALLLHLDPDEMKLLPPSSNYIQL